MGTEYKESTVPFLESSSSSSGRTGSASSIQTLGNIIVSIVGTGILGLPFAFKIAGWFAGSVGVLVAGIATYYCMLLLVQCRDKQASEELTPETKTYGDLGYECMGNTGRYLTEFLIFTSQCGGSVAYLVFIGQNLSSIFKSTGHGLNFSSYIFLLVPIEIALSWINSLSALAPFSIFADVCNMLAMAIVVKEDVEKVISGEFKFSDRTAITSNIGGLPFAGGMAVFCFEGFGMTLALEASMTERGRFSSLLAKAFTGITLVYVLFGFSGYMAYGDQTKDIITLNLPHNWSTIAVQIGLCLGLMFTFPIMVHPIHEIVEGKLENSGWYQKLHCNDGGIATRVGKFGRYVSRAILIVMLAVLASFVPGFGMFASLVGSTVCALISFVLPATFHLILLGPSLHFWRRALDYCILICGLLFAGYGTYNTVVGV
ncbi:amino acid transporter ANT1 [Ricinus communis]|uniref:Amino acid transporter, putative n=1 Tax=Ricinus communis TaxID=3988 RepID=B9SDP5_RICCO|nr:amino acid transporter ANT1 [Ricinus communis]EEF38324.1 amino acid transporter, putative [Ricinus communis]|eukprot:XP_002524114.1 amino acid transporter ANT1 [Ricinus communis]